jgi:hypothetical protein
VPQILPDTTVADLDLDLDERAGRLHLSEEARFIVRQKACKELFESDENGNKP